MSEASEQPGSPWAEALAGAGFGLLLGVIVGMSSTPVVKDVIVVLTGLLAVFLGLQAGGDAKIPLVGGRRSDPVRVGAFGLAAAVGLILGVFLRVANPFHEDPEIEAARWTKAFEDNPVLAHQAMLYERFGVTPALWTFDPAKEAAEATIDVVQAQVRRGGLFGVLQRQNLCNELDPALSSNDAEILLSVYDRPDEPVLLAVAAEVRKLPADERLGALTVAHTVFCRLAQEAREEARQ